MRWVILTITVVVIAVIWWILFRAVRKHRNPGDESWDRFI